MSNDNHGWPAKFRLERLLRSHGRKTFRSGEAKVDDWLTAKALQHQEKHLSVTKFLLDGDNAIAGYYTLATGQVDFGDLPGEVTKRLPHRWLPVAVLAWLGVSNAHQRQGLGRLLLQSALLDCYEGGKTIPFVAIVLDCVSDSAKAFFQRWDFQELPGNPYRLYLSVTRLSAMMSAR